MVNDPLGPKPSRQDGIIRTAVFHRNGCRLLLSRIWGNPNSPRPLAIGHNPSTANHLVDDPSSRRLIHFFKAWGYSGYDLANFYPFMTSSPDACRAMLVSDTTEWSADAVRNAQRENHRELADHAKRAPMILACWGDLVRTPSHVMRMIEHLKAARGGPLELYCLGTTASGNPKHPMARGRSRVPNDQQPLVWKTF